MNFVKKCPVLILLIASGILLAAAGIAGKNSIYKEYRFDMMKAPFLALALEGMGNHIYPWEVLAPNIKNKENNLADIPVMEHSKEDVIEKVMESFGDIVSAEAEKEEKIQDTPVKESAGGVKEEKEYEFSTVSEDYFNNAVFIGDSRTVGMFEYGGIEERADFFAKVSLTIYDVFKEPVAKDESSGEKITVEQVLQRKQYGKIYLMLGINELGTGTTETFMEEYKKVVEELRKLQPDAIIFVQGIMRVTASKDEADPIFNNTNINDKNSEIAKLADNKNVFYIDVNEVVCDENGSLNSEYTSDEVHFKAQYYAIWKQFLLEHGIVRS